MLTGPRCCERQRQGLYAALVARGNIGSAGSMHLCAENKQVYFAFICTPYLADVAGFRKYDLAGFQKL